jgi:hypothetical protein
VAEAEVINLATRRPRSVAKQTGEEAHERILELIGSCGDPVGAAMYAIAGLARYLALEGVTADQLAQFVERHMAEQLRDDPHGEA